MKNLLLRNKALTAGIAVLLVAGLAWLAFGFFGVHKAFVDDVVNEEAPVFDVAASAEAPTPVAQTAPIELPAEAESAAAPAAVEAPDTASEPAAGDAAEAPDTASEPAPAQATEAPDTASEPAPAQATEEPDAAAETAPEPAATAVPAATATPIPATTEPEPTPAAQTAPGEIVTQFSGSFQSLNDYSVSGTASVLNNGTDQRFLRFENFASDNGPDLKVYLRAANGEFISLGSLSGNIGNQNYEIPVGVDLNVFNSVEIWCERFNSGFGAARLNAA